MRDNYVGDIGDYVKYGLLRSLSIHAALRLGIAWYLYPDPCKESDGKYLDYLFSVSTFMRGHTSEAFSSARAAIDGALIGYEILQGSKLQKKYIEGDKSFLYLTKKIRKIIKDDNKGNWPITDLSILLDLHAYFSNVGSHADFRGFRHRLHVEEGRSGFGFGYFNVYENDSDKRHDLLTILTSFICILSIFKVFVRENVDGLDPQWEEDFKNVQGEILSRMSNGK